MSLNSESNSTGLTKEVWFYVSLTKNGPSSHLIYNHNEQLSNEFMASISNFEVISFHYEVHFEKEMAPIRVKYTIKQSVL